MTTEYSEDELLTQVGHRQEGILELLERVGQSLTMTEIADRTGQDKKNASVSLKNLLEEKYVVRNQVGRQKPYALTTRGKRYVAMMQRRNSDRPAFTRVAMKPQSSCGPTEATTAVEAASRLTVEQVFIAELAERLDTQPDDVLQACTRLCESGQRDELIEAVGAVMANLKPERLDIRRWMTVHLASLVGTEGLAELFRCSSADRVGYEIVIHADCTGVVECIVAAATGRPTDLKLVRPIGEEVPGFDSRYRIEVATKSLKGEREAADITDTRAEQFFIGGYARHPKFARISKSKVPNRYFKKKIREEKESPYYVVFDEESEDDVARRFQEALMNNEISVNIVLRGPPASERMAEIQAWLMEYFQWPLEEEIA